MTPVDQCTVTDDQYNPPHPADTFVGGRLGGGSLGSSGIGDGAQTDPTGAAQDSSRNGEEGKEDVTEERKDCVEEQREEREIDAAASATADAIRNLNNPNDNPNNNEFGVLIIRLSDNSIVFALPTEGITGSVSLDRMLIDARAEFGANINGSNIVGLLHSHPSSLGAGFNNVPHSDLPAIDQQATMPSHHLIGGIQRDANGLRARDPLTGHALLRSEMWDWGTGRRFLTRNGNTNVGAVSHYILGPDGVLREYDYSEQHPAESIEQVELINDAKQDADSKCE